MSRSHAAYAASYVVAERLRRACKRADTAFDRWMRRISLVQHDAVLRHVAERQALLAAEQAAILSGCLAVAEQECARLRQVVEQGYITG